MNQIEGYLSDAIVNIEGISYPAECLLEDGDGIRVGVVRDLSSIPTVVWNGIHAGGARYLVAPVPGEGWVAVHIDRVLERMDGDVREERRRAGIGAAAPGGTSAIPESVWSFHTDFPSYRDLYAATRTVTGEFVHLHAHSEFCLAPQTKVITADLKWKRIDEVVVGEQLVGFDEDLRPSLGTRGNSQSKMRRTTVTAVKTVVRDCYRIVLEDGTEIVSAAKHGWVVTGTTRGSVIKPDGPEGGYGSGTRRWLTTERLVAGALAGGWKTRGVNKPKLVLWAKPWDEVPDDLVREAAWLAGVADGEGWMHDGQVAFGQNPGLVLDEIYRACKALGYEVTAERVQSRKGECRTFRLKGYEVALRFLAQCQPVRFWDRRDEVWVGRRAGSRYTKPVQIVSVEHLGEREVIALQTTTGTFVAEGFLSHNSLLDGLSTVDEMVAAAVGDGQPALAVTDHGVCASHPTLQKKARAAGIKPIFGMEANFVDDRHVQTKDTLHDYRHLILWAKTDEGLRNLWAMSTEAYRTGFYGRPRLDWDILNKYSTGVMASTACLRGPLAVPILADDEEQTRQVLGKLLGVFGDDLFIELHTTQSKEQAVVNLTSAALALEFGQPMIAVTDSHYPTIGDKQTHAVWMASQTNKTLQEETSLFGGKSSYHLMGAAEVREALDYLPPDIVDQAMKGTLEAASRCDVTIEGKSTPPVYSKASDEPEAVSRDVERLLTLCLDNWDKCLMETYSFEVYEARFEREMRLLIDKGFCGYFLMVADYCLDPSTPVLTADLRWVEVGKLGVGDRLAGFDEQKVTKNAKGHRYWRGAEVVNTRRVVLPTFRVILDDGTETIASADHQWLVASPGGSAIRWVKTINLRGGQRPQRLVPEWDEPDTWEAGYLAGVLDGEGSLSLSKMNNGGRSLSLGFAQREGEVLDTALRILDAWGFDYSIKDHGRERNGLRSVWLRGGRSEVMRLLGMARPRRLLSKLNVDLLGRVISIDQPAIVSIESLGFGEVVALETSTGTLVAQGFAHHNCQWARKHGILVGPGRGSGSGSLVSYLAGITGIDPVETGLMFERFLTEGRLALPDFDVDFPASHRQAITDYIVGRYGEENVVRVGTQIRLKNKGIIRDLARTLKGTEDVSFADTNAISKLIDEAEADKAGLGMTWEDLWIENEEALTPWKTKYPMLFDNAEKMVGRIKTFGKHAAGVVIAPDAHLTERLPLRRASAKDHELVAEFDMDALDEFGFVKFDLLTLRTLDTIQMAVDLVREQMGEEIDPASWRDEFNDPVVWNELSDGHTLGVFQIETPGGTRWTKELRPQSLDDLADLLTLVRPGPVRSGLTATYLRRKAGTEAVSVPDPRLKEILNGTYGTMIYQEQVLQICMTLAGYDETEADDVRKILGKKQVGKVEEAGKQFVSRAVANQTDPITAEIIWGQMAEFSRYAFNRSHAYGYAVLGYWCAWLKFHYPVQFLAASLSTVDKARIPAFVNEARRMGFKVLPPDINLSGQGFRVAGHDIRYGFDGIKGIGSVVVDHIISGQPYQSFEDFMERRTNKVNVGIVKILTRVGAFDSLVPNRRALEGEMEWGTDESNRCHFRDDRVIGPNGLPCTFDWSSEPVVIGVSGRPLKGKPIPRRCVRSCRNYTEPKIPNFDWIPGYTPDEILARELEMLGIYLSYSPFDRLPPDFFTEPFDDGTLPVKGSEVETAGVGYEFITAGLISRVVHHVAKNGKDMGFLSVNAVDADLDLVVFSDEWQRYYRDLKIGTLCFIHLRKGDKGLALKALQPA